MKHLYQLLDIEPLSAPEYAAIEDLARDVLDLPATTFIFQGEAIVALEAAAKGLGRPGMRALNLVSGPYGATFGNWLSEAGADVTTLAVPFDRSITVEKAEEVLGTSGPYQLVSLVHAEAATGIANDLPSLARLAKAHGALLVVDAVASIGAEEVLVGKWGLDVVVLSAQKALAGPTGACLVCVSAAAWEALAAQPCPLRGSVLSLLDWHDRWTAAGRHVLPLLPNHLETRALGAALQRCGNEGLVRVMARHRASAKATRASLPALGLTPWAAEEGSAARVATLVKAPSAGVKALLAAALAADGPCSAAAPLGPAPGPLADVALRVNHTGRQATLPAVLASVWALARGLRTLGSEPDAGTALAAAGEAWELAYNDKA